MSLAAHEVKALAIELAAAMPPLAEPKQEQEREYASIDMLFNEMDALIFCLQEKMNAPVEDKRSRDIAYALAMALEHINNELGRTAGVIA